MNTIHNARFEFEMDISGDQASSISHRALEILQERLDRGDHLPATIQDLHVEPIELTATDLPAEDVARRIAEAAHSSITRRTGRSTRG